MAKVTQLGKETATSVEPTACQGHQGHRAAELPLEVGSRIRQRKERRGPLPPCCCLLRPGGSEQERGRVTSKE